MGLSENIRQKKNQSPITNSYFHPFSLWKYTQSPFPSIFPWKISLLWNGQSVKAKAHQALLKVPVVSPPGPQRVPPGLLQTAGIIFIMCMYIYIQFLMFFNRYGEQKKNRKRSRIVKPFKAERKIIFRFWSMHLALVSVCWKCSGFSQVRSTFSAGRTLVFGVSAATAFTAGGREFVLPAESESDRRALFSLGSQGIFTSQDFLLLTNVLPKHCVARPKWSTDQCTDQDDKDDPRKIDALILQI